MTDDLSRLTARLDELSLVPAPRSTVDIDAALTAGRKQLRGRRLLLAAGSGALVLALGIGTAALPGHGRAATPPASGRQAEKPTQTDPLVAPAAFGWLPPGADAGVGYGTVPDLGAPETALTASGAGDAKAAEHIHLRIYPAGVTPSVGKPAAGVTQSTFAGPPINGGASSWLIEDASRGGGPVDTLLRWQTPTGRWAEVSSSDLREADPRGTLTHVATDVRFGDTAIPLPLRITGVPKDFTLAGFAINRPGANGRAPWNVSGGFTTPDGAFIGVGVNFASVVLAPTNGQLCSTQGELTVCVFEADAPAPPSLVALGGLPGLLRHITLFGTDEHTWTTQVID
ncbi:serine/threonine-protein kinase [Kitasatospora mediocidica]|uniref:hypothetical protein n=1 Tax=Kitasatospora mediocidica TaxID=58352 RepID=UPI000560C2FD|nr:hypothetical protein [Kitasatospora mediocidica]